MPSLRSLVAAATLALVQTSHAWNVELPSCIDEFQPYVYSGCFQDGSPNALIYRSSQDQQKMTVEKCVAECKGNGFRYAGLKYYGVCFCGGTVNGPQIDESQCSFKCSGDKSQTCGGNSQLSVWADPTFDTGVRTISDYKPLGCYTDASSKGKTLSWPISLPAGSMTPSICLTACQAQGFPLAGLEYGGECWCGNVLAYDGAPTADSECDMPCKGDSTKMCGGRNRLNVWVAKEMESLQPCGWKASTSSSSSIATTTAYTWSSSAASSIDSTSSTSSTSSTTDSSTTTTTSSTLATSTTTAITTTTSESSTTATTTAATATTTSTTDSSTTTAAGSSTLSSSTSSTFVTSTTTTATPSSSSQVSSTTSTTSSGSITSTTSKSSLLTSSSSASAAMCTSTITLPSECEYRCGNWCAPSLPDWQNQSDCLDAYKSCAKLVSSCFKTAGWPGALDCFDFSAWCGNVKSFCSASCGGGRKCAKKDCINKYRPQNPSPVKTTTSVFPCSATTTTTTTPPPESATSVVPEPTNICTQPSDSRWGYGPGNPVAGIELPLVGCNDLKDEFSSRPFKIYTDTDSRRCKGYGRSQTPNACADACKEQYDDCVDVYVESCKRLNGGRGYFHKREMDALAVGKRWYNRWGGDQWQTANSKCKAQYEDCLSENKNVNAASRCRSWGKGV